jgi:hypothetical protein
LRRGPPRRTPPDASTPSPRSGTPRAASHAAVGVPRTGTVGVCGVQRSGAVERSERPPLRHRRDACGVTPRLSGWQAAMGASCFASGAALDRRGGVIASWPQCDVLLAPLWLSGDRCGSLDSIALCCCLLSVLMAQLRRAATFRFYRLRLKLDQRTRHGPHRCALSLKRAAVARSSVAHATHGWHCCSPERRGPAGTQVTRAVEK